MRATDYLQTTCSPLFIHPKKLFQTFVKIMLVPLSRMYLYFSVSKCSHVQCVGVVYSTV